MSNVTSRMRTATVVVRDHEGPDKYLISLTGYPLVYAADRAQLDQRLEELYAKEKVRLSFKRG